jgi:hypothetical protein
MEESREQLLERVKKAEEVAGQCQGEAGVYRDMLDKCRDAANKALETTNIACVWEIAKQCRLAADETLVKELGHKLIYVFWRDKRWLGATIQALENIKSLAENLEVEEGSPNAQIRQEILEATREGLITRL